MTVTYGNVHHPVEIRLKREERILEIDFETGETFALPAELLRVESPSAEVQGHSPTQKTVVPGRRHVGIMSIEPVGNYAVRIAFDDLHDSGLYSWDWLYKIGSNQDEIWAAYLDALESKGLSRDP